MNSIFKSFITTIFFLLLMLGLLTPYRQRTNIYASTNTCIALNSEKTRYGKDIQNYGGISRLQKGTNDTFLNYYFTNLIKNFGENPENYCNFVATGMVLSYYDTYWNDTLIPENYEISEQLTQNSLSYLDTITQSPGVQENYTYILNGDIHGAAETFKAVSIALGFANLEKLLEPHASTDGQLSFTLDYLDQGYPVIIELRSNTNDFGHVTVAFSYSYDKNGDILLFLHNGYVEAPDCSRIIVLKGNEINLIYTATVLRTVTGLPLPHVCSDNYYYTNTDGSVTAHCPCELEDHPAHSDRYTHSLAPLNGSQHSILCSGNGNIGTEDHTFQTVSFTDSAHTLSCACGYTAAEKHSLTYSGNFNDWIDDPIQSTHTVACACGYVDELPHELTAQSLNGGWHSVTCPCFGTENEPHLAHFMDVYIDGHLYKQCTVCGYLEW